jgi:hypothetical protein
MSNQAIQDAIAQAKAAAGNLPAETGAVVNYAPHAVARPITLADNLVGSFAVDTWLKVKPYGMTVGKDTTTLFDRLTFRIDLSAVTYCRRVRFGDPAEYRTTYDGLNDVRGGAWPETVARATAIDPKCQGDYRSADIALIVTGDIVAKTASSLPRRAAGSVMPPPSPAGTAGPI